MSFFAVLGLLLLGLASAATAGSADRQTYIVQLKAKPLSSYTGGIPGLDATSPKATGGKLDVASPEARAYSAYLDGKQNSALSTLGNTSLDLLYDYRAAFSGFAADLTKAQAAELQGAPEVASVGLAGFGEPEQVAKPTGGAFGESHEFLGLHDGIWERLGGTDHAGEKVIVGVLDTGIYPEHPSFADNPFTNGTKPYSRNYIGPPYDKKPDVWFGTCQTGEAWTAANCNNKLIGARYFVNGFTVARTHPEEFLSPRDADGHGTHTSSTAAGNYGTNPVVAGNELGIDILSGVSPRSHLAMYKVCWEGRPAVGTTPAVADGCSGADILAGINAAVADGVDVINYSIGSTAPSLIDATSFAFLGARDAGIFVSKSAGNSGPGASTIGDAGAPWFTSVAASTLAREFQASGVANGVGGPINFTGVSIMPGSPSAPLVNSADVGKPGTGGPGGPAELCFLGALDPAKVAGKIVVCTRGVNARVEKSHEVFNAGGVGTILMNAVAGQSLDSDLHWGPTIHVTAAIGNAIKALIAASGGSATAQLFDATRVPAKGDVTAGFSSRGPQLAPGAPDIAKPDIAAPGASILAGDSPTPAVPLSPPGQEFGFKSGTSMAAPHVAGVAALLAQLHPIWDPSWHQSAMMTTANPFMFKEDGVTPATPFDVGSGRVDPQRAADPGLVLGQTTDDYLSYVEGVDPTIFDGVSPLNPIDLNVPSISVSAFAGSRTTSRTFTSVDSTSQIWDAKFDGLSGLTATFVVAATTPSTVAFAIAPGQSRTLAVRITQVSSSFNAYASGALILTNRHDGRTVRLPITIQPVKIAPPPTVNVNTTAASGSQPLVVNTGYVGVLSGLGYGLAAPNVAAGQTIVTTSGNPVLPPLVDAGTKAYPVTVAAGAHILRGAITQADAGNPDTDLDLFLYRDVNANGVFASNELIAQSAGGDSNEVITLVAPASGRGTTFDLIPGNYLFLVVGFATATPNTVYDFTTWLENDASPDDPSNPPAITVTGDPVATTIAGTATLTLNWSGVNANGTYIGLVTYHDSGSPLNTGATPNRIGAQVVSITRSGGVASAEPNPIGAGTPPVGSANPPAVVPTPTNPAVTTPLPKANAKASLALKRARLVGRSVVFTVTANKAGTVQASVLKRAKVVAKSKALRVSSGTSQIRFKLVKPLKKGQYTVKLVARLGGAKVTRTMRLSVR